MRIRTARSAIVDGMTDPRRAEVEAAMQELIAASGLEPPDSVEHEPSAVVFKWTEPKLAVIVDLEDAATGGETPAERGGTHVRGH